MPWTLSFSLAVPQALDVSYSSGFIFDACAFAPPAGAPPPAAAAAAAVCEAPEPRRLSPAPPAVPLDPLEVR